MNSNEILVRLIHAISSLGEVDAIGMSGSLAIPRAGEGDIDLFIYCDDIPPADKRRSALEDIRDALDVIRIQVFEGQNWGSGDLISLNGVETWLMYFRENDAAADVEAILNGEYPDRVGDYYPIGRCAMLSRINILYDRKGFLAGMKARLSVYPGPLAQTLVNHHLGCLDDVEDLDRGAARKDALFYHYALDVSIDHFLQALFALNKRYFPSRKRSFEYIHQFARKPENCEERLLQVLRQGGYPEGITESYAIWRGLLGELRNMANGEID